MFYMEFKYKSIGKSLINDEYNLLKVLNLYYLILDGD